MGRLTSLPSAVITDDSALGGAVIEKSLRFNSGDSPYLSKSFASNGNRQTFTISCWIKKTHPTNRQVLLNQTATAGSNEDGLEFDGTQLRFYSYVGSSFVFQVATSRRFRDVNGWYHIVAVYDSPQATASNRVKVYVNGEQVTNLSTANYPSQNNTVGFFNTTTDALRIGNQKGNQYKFDGYMAEINFIDGIALDPSYFGYTEFQTGIWRPKGYFGSYGTNGFRLDFSDSSGTTALTLGKDRSGQGNDFTPNNFIVDAEIVTNGEFNSGDSNWTKDSSWSIANGKASNSGGGEIYQTIPVVSGVTYVMTGTVDITADSSVGNTTIGFRNTGNSQYYAAQGTGYTTFTANAVNQLYVKWTSNLTGNVRVRCYSSDTISIDNWSVKAIGDNFPESPTAKKEFATFNSGLQISSSTEYREGNLAFYTSGSSTVQTRANMSRNSGKWYAEFTLTTYTARSGSYPYIGVAAIENFTNTWTGQSGTAYQSQGGIWRNGSNIESGYATYTQGDVISVAINLDSSPPQVWWAKNGSYIRSGANPSTLTAGVNIEPASEHGFYTFTASLYANPGQWDANFGQQPFAYSVPTGFKSLNTDNIPINTPSVIRPQKHFDTLLYTGNGSSNNRVTGLQFKPDLVWIKSRTATDYHVWQDSVRGNFILYSDRTNEEGNTGGGWVKSFNDDGFTTDVNGPINTNGHNYAAWCWKAGGPAVSNSDGSITSSVSANQEAGFSIVTFTGTGSAGTIGHGLGKAPKMVITKRRNAAQAWFVHHEGLSNGHYLRLNASNAQGGDTNVYPNNMSTTNTFAVGGDNGVNGNGDTYVSYCWAEIPGYSKIGKYKGLGAADGAYVECGFRPAFVMYKRMTNSDDWGLHDVKRDPSSNPVYRFLYPDLTNAEWASGTQDYFHFYSNGFKLTQNASMTNGSGDDYVFMAFAEQSGQSPYHTDTNAR